MYSEYILNTSAAKKLLVQSGEYAFLRKEWWYNINYKVL